jgi:hypothetical protein
MSWRNRRYDRGGKTIQQVGVPVVSVGNITLGGTGKTPLVHGRKMVPAHQVRVCIKSGYQVSRRMNDESRELEQICQTCRTCKIPTALPPLTAIEELETQLIIPDDGFQHRRIARDLDIVLLDALEPFAMITFFPGERWRAACRLRGQTITQPRADAGSIPARQQRVRAMPRIQFGLRSHAQRIDWPVALARQWHPQQSRGTQRFARFAGTCRGGVLRLAIRRIPPHHRDVRVSFGRFPRFRPSLLYPGGYRGLASPADV